MNLRFLPCCHHLIFSTVCMMLLCAVPAYAVNHNPVTEEGTGYKAELSLTGESAILVESTGKIKITVTLEADGEEEALATKPVKIMGTNPNPENGDGEFEFEAEISASGEITKEFDPAVCGCGFTLRIVGATGGEGPPTEAIEIDADGDDSDPDNNAPPSDGGGGGGPSMDIGLGKAEAGQGSAGKLGYAFTQPDEKMYRVEGLRESITLGEEAIVRVDGPGSALRQVMAPERLTDIQTISAQKYQVKSYDPGAVTGMSGGLHLINPAATPLRTVTVENPGAIAIANTSDAGLFHQVRWGKAIAYDLPVENNRYKVELKFVELHQDSIGANTFNVIAEGSTKLAALDVRSEAGARYTALSKEISTLVTDKSLRLEFKAVQGGAHVAAFSVLREAIPAVANTADADLYQTARTGDFSYNLSLPNGSYEVSLHFIEPAYDVAAARLFDVSIEGAAVLSGFDIRSEAGARDHAHVEVIPVTLTDGTLDIDFVGATDKARLSALVVRDTATHAIVTAINAGGPAYTAADSTAFVADAGFTGGEADFPGRVIHAVNAGGQSFTATDSTVYAADNAFTGGKAFSGAFNRLLITTQDGTEDPKPYDYTWVANPETGKFDEMILSHAGGLKRESRIQTWTADGLSYDETITLYNPDNTPVSKVVTTYEKFPFGMRKVREVRDPDGAAPVVTTWSYVEGSGNPDDRPPGYGRLKREVDPRKGWTDYAYDSQSRIASVTRGTLNATPGTLAGARVETRTYSSTNPRVTRVVTVGGQEVARSWNAEETTATTRTNKTITATVAGAAWTDSTNLVSTTFSYTAAETDALKRNKTGWTESPDGTMTFYAYAAGAGGATVTTRETGAPNGGKTAIVGGTRTITTTNVKGHQIAEQTIDIDSGLTLTDWQALEVDSLGRPTEIGYGDGTMRSLTYVGSSASCGSCSTAGTYLVESEIDRDGVTTTYAYDALKRRTGTIRFGIREKVIYDAADRVTERIRVGSDSSEITLGKTAYDLAGRVIAVEDALENVTTIAYTYPSEGGLITTTTNPAIIAGSGTRVETVYADGRLKEVSGTAVSPLKYAYGTWAATGEAGEWTQEIKVGEASAETEWIKTYTDLAGRSVKAEYPDAAEATMAYNALGQLVRQTDPDGVQTLFAYNAKGEREVTAIDLNQNGIIDHAGLDRITQSTSEVVSKSGTVVRRVSTRVWHADNTDVSTLVSITEQDGYGNQSWQTDAAGAVSSNVTTRTSAGAWTVTATAPDGSSQVQTYASGRLVSAATYTSTSALNLQTTYAYDPHGRLSSQTDARTGAVDYTYTDRDEVLTVTSNNGTETTAYTYDALGNQLTITRPDSSVTTHEYHLRNNQLKKTSGSQTYPVEYTYDPQGRMKTLTTWQNATTSAGAAVTTWNYDSQRGWLSQKLYADNTGPSYTYTPAGRLLTRTWARLVSGNPLITTYAYSNAGDLVSTDYSDTTPDVAIAYTRFGAQKTVTDATGTRTFTYTAALRPDQEQLPSFYGDRILTRSYQTTGSGQVAGRNDGFGLGVTGDLDQDYDVVYGYDNSGRLGSVTDSSGTHTYAYLANSNLRHTLTSPVHITTTAYETYRNVIASVENRVGATVVSNYAYTVNALGQRTARANTGTAFGTAYTDVFTYNAKGEVTAATNATLTARDQSFAYDDIGNRLTFTTTGGTTNYTANSLNAYTAIGAASPTHDEDGNQTTTGTGQVYFWDAENRLVLIEPVIPTTGDKKQLNVYDAQSRRVRKQVSTYSSGTWSLTTDEKFIYDGWNLVAVLDAASSNSLLRTYTWGTDLSGSLQGAGGVGGLLSAKDGSSVYHYTYDANGNVSEVLNNSGSIVAHYEYDAFGNTVASSGIYAATNAYHFSTKPLDSVSELYYYGLRYYNPSTGRWPSRDPIAERGGRNLYGFVNNAPSVYIDYLGLDPRTSSIGANGLADSAATGRTNCLGYAASGGGSSEYFEPTHPARGSNKDRSIKEDMEAEGWSCEEMSGPTCMAPCDYEKMVIINYLTGNKNNKNPDGTMKDSFTDKGVQFGKDGTGGEADFHAMYSSSGCAGPNDYQQIPRNLPAGSKPEGGVNPWDYNGKKYCCKRKKK